MTYSAGVVMGIMVLGLKQKCKDYKSQLSLDYPFKEEEIWGSEHSYLSTCFPVLCLLHGRYQNVERRGDNKQPFLGKFARMVTAGNTECQNKDLRAETCRSVSLCLEIYKLIFPSKCSQSCCQAPDTHHKSVDVFTVCLNQVDLGLGLLILFRAFIKHLLYMLFVQQQKVLIFKNSFTISFVQHSPTLILFEISKH